MPPKRFYAKKSKDSIMNMDSNTVAIGNVKWLIIVESPSKCAKIEHYLGHEYKCIASKGHIREIVGLKNIDTGHNFHPTFTIIPDKSGHIEQMRKIIGHFSWTNILLATDDDREGEAIAWHICEVFGLPVDTTPRIMFHEITKPAILTAVQNPGYINQPLVYAQHARQILDIIVGFKISPLLWRYVHKGKKDTGLSAGRCQTPALRLVYDNEMARIKGTGLETKYKTIGHFFCLSQTIDFELNREFDDKDSIKEFLDRSIKHVHQMTILSPKESKRSPPKPFNTSRLLQIASQTLHTSPKQTMQICQNLYQNGHITYMRTDNTKYAPAFLDTMSEFLLEEYKDSAYICENIHETLSTSLDNQTSQIQNPHEAIRITNIQLRELPSNADPREASMYRLIWRNTVQSCMSDAIYKIVNVRITAPMDLHYSHCIEIPKFLGWKRVKSIDNDPNLDNNNTINPESRLLFLSALSPETMTNVPYSYIDSTVTMRNHTSHYTEASLIQKLEDLGIGRPSTFASLVDTIQTRGYVKHMDIKGTKIECEEFILRDNTIESKISEKVFGQEKSKLAIQPIGRVTMEFLVKHFEQLFSYDYTKQMEQDLDQIHDTNESSWTSICRKCYLEIQEMSKPLIESRTGKCSAYKIDDENELLIQPFGASIRNTSNETGQISYLPARNDLDIDFAKLGNNGETYQVSDIVAFKKSNLGEYAGLLVTLHNGKYGPYIRWGDKTQSLGDISIQDITLEHVIPLLDNTRRPPPPPKNAAILRPITMEMSIRSGKFGPYVYYKTDQMKKPAFIPLKKFNQNPITCNLDILTKWIHTQPPFVT